MSNKYLTIQFGANTTNFKKGINEVRAELTELNSAYSKNKKAQSEVRNEIKELEKQEKALKTAMSQVKTPTKEMTDEADRLQKALDQAALKAAKLKTEEQELKGKISSTTKELNEQNASAEKNAITMEKVGNAMKKAATLTATGMAALFTYTNKMAASAGDIDDMSKKIGISVEEVQKLMYAAELSGTSYETLTGVYSKLIKNMDAATKGTGDAYEGFKQLGVPVTDANDKLRDHNEVLAEVLDALGKVENETERDAIALSILGKSALELNPLIEGGKDMLKEFSDELERQGVLLDQSQIDKLADFDDKLVKFKSTFQAKMMESSVDWIDAFDDLFEKSDEIVELVATLISGFAKVTGYVVDHKEAVLALVIAYSGIKAIKNVTSLANSVINTYKKLTKATEGATKAQKLHNAAVKVNPYLMLLTGLNLLVSAFKQYKNASSAASQHMSEFAGTTKSLADSISDSVASARSEVDILKLKAERYEELRTTLNRTAEQEAELYDIAKELQSSYPDQISLIDQTTGSYKEMGVQLEITAQKIIETAEASAKAAALQDAYAKKYAMEAKQTTLLQDIQSYDTVSSTAFADNGHLLTRIKGTWEVEDWADTGAWVLSQKSKQIAEYTAEYNDIVDELKSIDELINNLLSDPLTFKGSTSTGESQSDEIQELADVNRNLAEELSVLKEKYDLLSSAEKELQDNQQLSVETLNAIVSKYPNLQSVVNDYISGIASGKDVINQLQSAYDTDSKNYQSSITSKVSNTENFYKYIRKLNDSYINTLADKYGIDLSNYKNYADAKLAIENAFLTAKAKNWAKYYDIESGTYKITSKDLMQYKKDLMASGMSDREASAYLAEYKQDYWNTVNAVNEWNSLGGKLDTSVYDAYNQYTPTYSNSSSGSSSSSSTSKKEVSVYEQAQASFAKLVNDRIAEIEKLTKAEVSGADERIAAIESEIEAREKLADTEDVQKRIDFLKAQLKYSMLDDFERAELEKQLADIEKEQSDRLWEDGKRAEINAIEAEKAAIEASNQALIDDLNNRMNYANTLFTDLKNGYKAATTIANNNSKTANITIVEKALTTGQVTQIVKDALGIGEVF